jgi:hypothetical protein
MRCEAYNVSNGERCKQEAEYYALAQKLCVKHTPKGKRKDSALISSTPARKARKEKAIERAKHRKNK